MRRVGGRKRLLWGDDDSRSGVGKFGGDATGSELSCRVGVWVAPGARPWTSAAARWGPIVRVAGFCHFAVGDGVYGTSICV
ncbi:hypothetical protein E2562_024497 [Oryza meyeriana var. granulata]|uniref:Uncharacterized protein n=1 Tax=Oryza meyeriana var. granulata TaxID=110450 RepID=A0A6G1BNK7_9ORYZ|nr:hypothetical protein E2562_024497 [Oryza meyeriana var. granulata]